MYMEPWQVIGLAFIAALIGGAIGRAGLSGRLNRQMLILGQGIDSLRTGPEGMLRRADLDEAIYRLVERLDPEKRREREHDRMQKEIPGFGAPITRSFG